MDDSLKVYFSIKKCVPMTMHCKVNLEQEEAMVVDPDGLRTLTEK